MTMTDRQRVELLFPGLLLADVVRSGVVSDADRTKEAEALLIASSVQVIADLGRPERDKLLRRASRLFHEVVGRYRQDGAVLTLALIGFFFLDELSASGYLVVGEASALSRAIDVMLPELELAAAETSGDDVAREHARLVLVGCQERGYYRQA